MAPIINCGAAEIWSSPNIKIDTHMLLCASSTIFCYVNYFNCKQGKEWNTEFWKPTGVRIAQNAKHKRRMAQQNPQIKVLGQDWKPSLTVPRWKPRKSQILHIIHHNTVFLCSDAHNWASLQCGCWWALIQHITSHIHFSSHQQRRYPHVAET